MTEPMHCPVCLGENTVLFLDRAHVPVHQNLLMSTADAARAIKMGRLSMRCCEACGFAFNSAFDPSLLSYGGEYENTQTYSALFEQYVEARCSAIISKTGSGATIVEVGCGNGFFLRKLLDLDPNATGIGFDPSYAGEPVVMNGRLRFERRFYDASASTVRADLVICRHVIEHVESPIDLLRAMRAAVGNSPAARICFETPDLDWILKNGVSWDLFYEHCSLFTSGSLRTALETTGFDIAYIDVVFGEQYLWLEAVPALKPSRAELRPRRTASLASEFGRLDQKRLSRWHEWLIAWTATGPLALWGAGAKGVTFAALVDPDRVLLSAVVDANPAKQGHFVPGTAHRIVAPQDLTEIKPAAVIVLNPAYVREIEETVEQLGLKCPIIDLMHLPAADLP